MTNQEFSNEFDILYNNIMSNQAPGLDEYEKSVLLTQSQEGLIKSLYNGSNPTGESLEETEELRRYLSELVKTSIAKKIPLTTSIGLSDNSTFFLLPDDVWFITYESVILEDSKLGCMNGKSVSVVPVTQDTFSKINDNPFKGPNNRKVLRLDADLNKVELVSKYNIKEYKLRYITKPSPIILTDLDEGLSIDGISKETECKLNPVLHRNILERAVQLASTLYK